MSDNHETNEIVKVYTGVPWSKWIWTISEEFSGERQSVQMKPLVLLIIIKLSTYIVEGILTSWLIFLARVCREVRMYVHNMYVGTVIFSISVTLMTLF